MIPQAAQDQYRTQARVAAVTAASVAKLWRTLGEDFSNDWVLARPRVLFTVQQGREAAVRTAIPYTPAVLAETGQVAPATGDLNASRFTSAAPDGRPMGSLLDESLIAAKVAVKAGAPVPEALQSAGSRLTRDVLTVLADTRRQVFHADIIQRPALGGYARMLNPPSCSRCVVLAGKWFAWNKGFLRHPRCDCIHIPASESTGRGIAIDPADSFNSLSRAEQDATFTKSGARAIRDGADMNRVENVRLRGLGTAKANRRYGTPSRLTVDDIYRVAGSRTNAIRLLEQEGYILPTFFSQ
jgi:hypothetical protein